MTLRIEFIASIVLYLCVIAHGQSIANLVAQLREAPTEVDRLAILSDEDFLFDFLHATTGVTTGAAGHTVAASSENFPAVVNNGVSMTVGFLGPCGMNTPHTHPRATEINFSLNTTLQAGFLMENGARFVDVEIAPGSAAVFPQGAIHFEMNPSCEPAMFVAAFNNEDPGVSQIAQRYFGLPSDIVGATLNGLGVVEVEGLESKISDNVAFGVESCLLRCNITRGDQPTLQLQPVASSAVATTFTSTILPSNSSLSPATSMVSSASTIVVNSVVPTSSQVSSSSVVISTYPTSSIYSNPTLSITPSSTYSPSASSSISQNISSSPSIYSSIYSYTYSSIYPSASAASSYYSSSATVSSYSRPTTTMLTSSFWTFTSSATKSAIISSFSSLRSASPTSIMLTTSSSPSPSISSNSISSSFSSVISHGNFPPSSSSFNIPTSAPSSSLPVTQSISNILPTSSPTITSIPIPSSIVSSTIPASSRVSGAAFSSSSASSAKLSSSASFSTAITTGLSSSVTPSASIGSSMAPIQSTTTIIVSGTSITPTDAVSQQARSSAISSSTSSFAPIPSVFITHTLSWESTLIPTASGPSSTGAVVGRLVRRSDANFIEDSAQYARSLMPHASLNPVIIALISVNSALFVVLVVALFFWIRRRNRRAAHRAHQYVLPVRAPHIPPKEYRNGFDTDEMTPPNAYSNIYPSTIRYNPSFYVNGSRL